MEVSAAFTKSDSDYKVLRSYIYLELTHTIGVGFDQHIFADLKRQEEIVNILPYGHYYILAYTHRNKCRKM